MDKTANFVFQAPHYPRVTPKLIGEFVDSKAGKVRTPKAVTGRLIEEVTEAGLAVGMSAAEIVGHVMDSIHNQALKASRKVDKTVFPSQVHQVEGDAEGLAGELADVSLVLKDLCWVAGISNLDDIEAEKNHRFMNLGDYNVAPNGTIYRVKAHVKT